MKLELFTKKGGRLGRPVITITSAGQIGINSSCLSKYFTNKGYALLYGDKVNKIIGIKPTAKEGDNAFKISYSVNKSNGSISGHSFLNHIEINFKEKSLRYFPEWDQEEGMLIIKFL